MLASLDEEQARIRENIAALSDGETTMETPVRMRTDSHAPAPQGIPQRIHPSGVMSLGVV
jgi:hypothetical protein